MQDNYLTALVERVNEGVPGSEILLTVGGLVIRGLMISDNEYDRELMETGANGTEAVLVAEAVGGAALGINLRDVTIGNDKNAVHVPLWRGKISAVDGFSLLSGGIGVGF